MKIISHRGNLKGINKSEENTILAIHRALDYGFDVEIDIWFENQYFYLGHDNPTTKIDISNFNNKKIWFHAKNIKSLVEFKNENIINYFWHEEDQATIVSSGYFWLYPGIFINNKNCIFVLPEQHNCDLLSYSAYGICTDEPIKYQNLFKI